jgi:hypothetical protein
VCGFKYVQFCLCFAKTGCVAVNVYLCVRIYILFVYLLCICVYMYMYECEQMRACMCLCVYVCVCVCGSVCVRWVCDIFVRLCSVYVDMCVYV